MSYGQKGSISTALPQTTIPVVIDKQNRIEDFTFRETLLNITIT